MLVVDASVAVLWFLPQERSAVAREVMTSGEELVGPPLLSIEVGSALIRAVRRGEISDDVARRSLFVSLPGLVRLDGSADQLRDAYGTASLHGGSVTDAVYIAPAKLLGATLLTDDVRMRGVALAARVPALLLGQG